MFNQQRDTLNLEDIVNIIAEAACKADQSGKIIYASPQLYDMLGYHPDDLIGKNIFDFVNPEDLADAKRSIQEALGLNSLVTLNFKVKHKEGHFLPVFSRERVVERNGVKQLVFIIRDQSESLKIELELQNRAKKLEILNEIIRLGSQAHELISFLETAQSYILNSMDFDGGGIYLLNKAEHIATVVTSKNLPKIFVEEVKVLNIEKEPYNMIFVLGKPIFANDYKTVNKERATKYGFTSLASVPIISEDEIVGAINIISKKKVNFSSIEKDVLVSIANEIGNAMAKIKAEENFRKSFQRVEFYKDLVVHDILNIVQNIKTSIDLNDLYSKSKFVKYPPQYFFEIIQNEVERAINLVVNVRKIAVLDESTREIVPTEIIEILNKIVKSVLNRFGSKMVDIKIDSNFERLEVLANDFISDVFENILINAVKHNSSEKAEITIKVLKNQENGSNFARLEFLDNGNGIPENIKEKIFERAYREPSYSGGMGIGLSLVKKIVESYKGKVWVEDKVKGDYEQGSTFVVLIPIAPIKEV